MMIYQRISLALLRMAVGWFFFYSGLIKILDPHWSAASYLNSASSFKAFYHWLASPGVIQIVNLLNEWGLVLIGASLILGLFVRQSSFFGAVLMLLYYFAALKFPYAGSGSYI